MNYSPDTTYRMMQERAFDLQRTARKEQLLRSNRRSYRMRLAQWLTAVAARLEGQPQTWPQPKAAVR
jgi:hypothetical protein